MTECGKTCEVYSRIVGYFRPVQNWNLGKQEEFKDRLAYHEKKTALHEFGKPAAAEAKAVAKA